MHTLYPEITPRQHWMLAVGDGHELYVEEMGNPEGLPVLVLHGGPGAGCSPDSRRFFDPHVYRIVCFDQRGAGRSRPRGGLTANTTGHLLDDIELILAHLAIKRVTLFGGSWGATLALLFAIRHPMTVLGCILRGTFLGRPQDIDWLYQRGASDIYPSAWRDFLVPLTPQESVLIRSRGTRASSLKPHPLSAIRQHAHGIFGKRGLHLGNLILDPLLMDHPRMTWLLPQSSITMWHINVLSHQTRSLIRLRCWQPSQSSWFMGLKIMCVRWRRLASYMLLCAMRD